DWRQGGPLLYIPRRRNTLRPFQCHSPILQAWRSKGLRIEWVRRRRGIRPSHPPPQYETAKLNRSLTLSAYANVGSKVLSFQSQLDRRSSGFGRSQSFSANSGSRPDSTYRRTLASHNSSL